MLLPVEPAPGIFWRVGDRPLMGSKSDNRGERGSEEVVGLKRGGKRESIEVGGTKGLLFMVPCGGVPVPIWEMSGA